MNAVIWGPWQKGEDRNGGSKTNRNRESTEPSPLRTPEPLPSRLSWPYFDPESVAAV